MRWQKKRRGLCHLPLSHKSSGKGDIGHLWILANFGSQVVLDIAVKYQWNVGCIGSTAQLHMWLSLDTWNKNLAVAGHLNYLKTTRGLIPSPITGWMKCREDFYSNSLTALTVTHTCNPWLQDMMLQDWILKHASNNNNYYFSVKKKN